MEHIVLLFVSKTLIKKLLQALFHLMTHLGKYQNKIGEEQRDLHRHLAIVSIFIKQ